MYFYMKLVKEGYIMWDLLYGIMSCATLNYLI